MRLVLLCLLCCCCCCGIWSLKCRSQDGLSDEELKRIVRSCMQRGGSGNQDDNEHRRYNYDNNNYSQDNYRQGQGERDRQNQGQGMGQGQQSYGNRWQRSLKHSELNNNRPSNNNNNNNYNNNNYNNNTGELSSCVAQCFFEEMNMVDANGQPDRRKVSYLLTKDLRDRALRNFYMDTVQQCFRYLEQSRYQSNNNNNNNHNNNSNNNNNNRCGQSRELIKCMAEYAKAQCDDWEEHSNLLFT